MSSLMVRHLPRISHRLRLQPFEPLFAVTSSAMTGSDSYTILAVGCPNCLAKRRDEPCLTLVCAVRHCSVSQPAARWPVSLRLQVGVEFGKSQTGDFMLIIQISSRSQSKISTTESVVSSLTMPSDRDCGCRRSVLPMLQNQARPRSIGDRRVLLLRQDTRRPGLLCQSSRRRIH